MNKFDLVVIGGGPAGLMAAGKAAERGAKVLLLEKNVSVGIKLLMTGGGRCNFTNQLSPRGIADAFGGNGRWLLSALSRFGSDEIISFFKTRGVAIKVEANGRVFPKSDQARELLDVLINYVNSVGVEIRTGVAVTKLEANDNSITRLVLSDLSEIRAEKYLIATGGRSYPHSGSSGDAYTWLKGIGHRVSKPRAALTPIDCKNDVSELQGISISSATLRLFQGDKKVAEESGDFIFTASGLSGPAALNLSRAIARRPEGEFMIKIDFLPTLNQEQVGEQILTLINNNKQHDAINIISQLIPKRLANYLLAVVNINQTKKGNGITKSERLALVSVLKSFSVSVSGMRGFNEAMITAGGVDLREVDAKTMKSLLFNNLYFAGEILDLDGPTGGYNLQVAWTTGYVAGESASN